MRPTLCKLLALACLAAPAAARPLTPEDLQSIPRIGELQISPDGHWLAVETGHELRIYPWALGAPVARFKGAGSPRWTPDSTRLLMQNGGQLYESDSRNWRLRQLTHLSNPPEAAIWSRDGQQVAFAAPLGTLPKGDSGRLYHDLFERRWNHYYDGRRRHLFVMNRAGGAPRDVTPGDYDAYPTSGTFSSGDNHCFSADGKALLFSAPPAQNQATDTNYDLWRVDLASLKRDNLTKANLAADIGPLLSVDGSKLYVHSQTRQGYESDFYHMRSCPVDASGRPQGEWKPDGPQGDFSVGEFIPTPAGAFYNRIDGPYLKAFRVGAGKPLNTAGSRYDLTCDRYGSRWAGVESALNELPKIVLGQDDKRRYFNPDPMPKLDFGAVESVQVPVEGASMQMWVIKPPGFNPARKYPVAYLIHGGPQGAWMDSWGIRWNGETWAAQGYVVAMPNPHGSSDQGLAYQEAVSRDWGGRPYRDLMTGADFMANLPYVDSKRMMAAGASYGGYMIDWIAVHTDRFKCLVTHDGIWNLESMYGATDELWFANWEFGGPPWNAPGDYERYSPHKLATELGRFKTPMLVIHNDLDYRCPLDQGVSLFTALRLQGVPARFLNFPDEGHHVLKPANSIRWYHEVLSFARHYCPPNSR